MIELVIRYDNGPRSISKFRGIREYTDWLINHPAALDSLGVRGYDVRELDICLSHDWMYVPLADRTYIECNFKCNVCDAGIKVSHATLDGLYIDNPSMRVES